VFLVVLAVLMVVVLARMERPRRPPPSKPPEPARPYVEQPLPLEAPWGPPKVPNADLPADVDEVLAKKCRRCHGTPPRNAAPFPLYTWADTQGKHNGRLIYERMGWAVQTGFMPNMIRANPPVEPLTDIEKQTLLAWVAAGGPSASSLAKTNAAASGSRRLPKAKPSASEAAPSPSRLK
jgi:hypothetical protein